MSQARRRTRREAGASNGLPGWAMLTIGLIIGLFVAFLVYLDDLEKPPNAAVESSDGGAGGNGAASGKDTPAPDSPEQSGGDGAGGKSPDKPRFEFYSILPELEVVVPEQNQPDQDAPAASDQGGGDGAGTGEAGEVTGRFYLQAGSFQQADQAENMKAKIALLGLDVAIQRVEIEGEQWHRVRVGPYDSRSDLQSAQKRLRDNDIDFLVLREKTDG